MSRCIIDIILDPLSQQRICPGKIKVNHPNSNSSSSYYLIVPLFSYIKLLLVDLCLCDDLEDDELELEMDCEGMEWELRSVFRRKMMMGNISPPPPYEHPPPYSVAINNELEYLYSHVIV